MEYIVDSFKDRYYTNDVLVPEVLSQCPAIWYGLQLPKTKQKSLENQGTKGAKSALNNLFIQQKDYSRAVERLRRISIVLHNWPLPPAEASP